MPEQMRQIRKKLSHLEGFYMVQMERLLKAGGVLWVHGGLMNGVLRGRDWWPAIFDNPLNRATLFRQR